MSATAQDGALEVFPARAIDVAEIEAGRRLCAGAARFVAGAGEAAALPAQGLPEIAFLGRSNVGKSTLVNALTGRRLLARTSQTPGRTRQINFFALDRRLLLVDLPGYGYAEAPHSAIKAWTQLVRRYLRERGTLRRVCLLVDARHGLKDPDRPVMRLCDEVGLSYQVVLTKVDKLPPPARLAAAEAVAAELASGRAAHPEIHLTSAETGLGIAVLRAAIAGFAADVACGEIATPVVAPFRSAR